jgi:hypothetical protein
MSLPSARKRNKRNSATCNERQQEVQQKQPQKTAKKTAHVAVLRMLRIFPEGRGTLRNATMLWMAILSPA